MEEQCKKLIDGVGVELSSEVVKSRRADGVEISLDLYEDIYINDFMCTSDCPCKATDK